MNEKLRKRLDEEVKTLQLTRDELRVQIHLGAAEARDRWTRLEKSWDHLEARLKRLGQATQESVEDVERAAKSLVEEIKLGYKHIRDFM